MKPDEWSRVGAWLSERGRTINLTNTPQRFASGIANENYLVDLDGSPAVFRRPPGAGVAPGANDMGREAKILTALNGVFPLAPQSLAYCSDPTVIGVQFQLIEFRQGEAIGSEIPLGAPPDAPTRLTRQLMGAMASLHALDVDTLNLDGLGSPNGFLTRQVRSWRRRAEAVWPEGLPQTAARLADRLAAEAPTQDEPTSLLHMDLKFDNVLFDVPTAAARAVIDWDMATRGPATFDLAIVLAYWVQHDDPQNVHPLARVPSLAEGFPSRQEAVGMYVDAARRPPTHLVWNIALARFRLAVLWMQLYRAWQRRVVVGDVYGDFDSLALSILDWAEHLYMKDAL